MGKFHSREGLCFESLEDGRVSVTFEGEALPGEGAGVILDANTWSSVIASMSARGEDSDTFYAALDFHTKDPFRLTPEQQRVAGEKVAD